MNITPHNGPGIQPNPQTVSGASPYFYQDQTFDYLFLRNRTHFPQYRIVAATTDAAAATTVGGDYVMTYGGTIEKIGATVDTAGTTGTLTVDVNKNGTTILSTKITVDTGEKTSRTAATAPVLSVRGFSEGDIFTFDIDGIHSGTASKGLTIFFRVIQLTR